MNQMILFVILVWIIPHISVSINPNLILAMNAAINHALAVLCSNGSLQVHTVRDSKKDHAGDNRIDQFPGGPTDPHPESPKDMTAITPEAILRTHMLSDYYPDTRPVKNPLTRTIVNISLNIRQVMKLDEQNQIMTTSLMMYLRWVDEFLKWDPGEYSNITNLFFSSKEIWIPDIVLFNRNASVDRSFSQNYEQYMPTVHYDGTVQWVYADVARTYCSVNITLFPFDYQSCALEIQSWSRAKQELLPHYVPVDKMDCSEMKAEWNIKHIKWTMQEDNSIPWIKLVLVIKRNSTFYLYHLIFPFFLLSCLTLFVFWLPPDSGEKITLTITILLALTFFLQLISNYTPKASENLPIIGIYFNINLILVLVSVVMTILVLNVHFRGPRTSPVPNWVKKYIIHSVGAFIRVRNASKQSDIGEAYRGHNNVGGLANTQQMTNNAIEDGDVVSVLDKVRGLTNELREYLNFADNTVENTMKVLIVTEINECNDLVRSIHETESGACSKSRNNDWRILAIVIDRICFIAYMICVLSSILFFAIKYSQCKNKM